MRLLLILLMMSSCQYASEMDGNIESRLDSMRIASITPGEMAFDDPCGSPNLIVGDKSDFHYTKLLKINVRFLRITNDKTDTLTRHQVSSAIYALNEVYLPHGWLFVSDKVETIVDAKSSREGIRFYDKHARLYAEIGWINILVYKSSLDGTFPGAAIGIPSIAFAIQEYYLDQSTCPHEAAHCFGLFHTHTIDPSQVKNSYYGGDFICQTPYADFYTTSDYGYIGKVTDDCEYFGVLGNLTQEEHNRNIRNIESYSLMECRKEVLFGQNYFMRWNLKMAKDLQAAVEHLSEAEYQAALDEYGLERYELTEEDMILTKGKH